MNRGAAPHSPPAPDDRLASVRAHDYDRYLSALLAPADKRMDLMLLYALDAELARIPQTVREPMLAEIRLQWWRDALAPLLTDTGRGTGAMHRTGHPLADAFLELARTRALPAGLIHGLIDARSTDFVDRPLQDKAELWTYLAKTETAILLLAARILGTQNVPGLDEGAASAGRAIGLMRLARRLAAGHASAEMLTPLTLWPLDDRHVHPSDAAVEARFTAARTTALLGLSDLASTELTLARRRLCPLPGSLRPAFLPLALVPRYATHVRRLARGAAMVRDDIHPMVRLWTLWRARRTARLA